jgi:hypothetical protein
VVDWLIHDAHLPLAAQHLDITFYAARYLEHTSYLMWGPLMPLCKCSHSALLCVSMRAATTTSTTASSPWATSPR